MAASGAYYNEIDPFAAAWLRQLMAEGLIAAGEVDERSIEDVYPDDLKGFVQCHFFAGIGVWSLALRMAGWPDDREIWTGSCPCQPFSAAGKGGGFDDERHLWPAFHWLIEKRRPVTVLGEQVASADGLHWLDLVSSDLEGSGYAFGALDTCAAGFSAPHIRQRFYWLGHSVGAGLEGYGGDQAARGRNGAKRSAPAPSIPVRLADAMSARRAEWRSGARFGSPAGVCGAGGMDVAVGFGWEPGRGDNAQYDDRPVASKRLWRGGRLRRWRINIEGTIRGIGAIRIFRACRRRGLQRRWSCASSPQLLGRCRLAAVRGAGNAINLAQAQGFVEAVREVIDAEPGA